MVDNQKHGIALINFNNRFMVILDDWHNITMFTLFNIVVSSLFVVCY